MSDDPNGRTVDYNAQITLIKTPNSDYPAKQDVFQLKYVPPTPVDQLV